MDRRRRPRGHRVLGHHQRWRRRHPAAEHAGQLCSPRGTTSTSTNLSWSASNDNVGVDRLRHPARARCQSGGTFTQVGTSTTTSFQATGLTATRRYRFQVRAAGRGQQRLTGVRTRSPSTTGGGGGDTQRTDHARAPWPPTAPRRPAPTCRGALRPTTWRTTGTTSSRARRQRRHLRHGRHLDQHRVHRRHPEPEHDVPVPGAGPRCGATCRPCLQHRTVTTPGGGGGGACTASMPVQSQWNVGYVVQATTSATSAVSGWTVTFTCRPATPWSAPGAPRSPRAARR